GKIPLVGDWLNNKINDDWARRNGGIHKEGDGTYTLPNGTIYDPKKGPPTDENRQDGPKELTDEDKKQLDAGTPAEKPTEEVRGPGMAWVDQPAAGRPAGSRAVGEARRALPDEGRSPLQ